MRHKNATYPKKSTRIIRNNRKGGVPQAYIRARASSATLCAVHVFRVFLCLCYIKRESDTHQMGLDTYLRNMRTYPRSGFRSVGTSECTLVPVFVPGEHSPKPPFWKPPFLSTPEKSGFPPPPQKVSASRILCWFDTVQHSVSFTSIVSWASKLLQLAKNHFHRRALNPVFLNPVF